MKTMTALGCLLLLQSQQARSNEAEALQAIKAFGTELKTTLTQALEKSPTHAIEVCRKQAPAIAQSHSSKDLSLGRVSSRTRNPKNKPKEWMTKSIADFEAGKIKSDYHVVAINGDRKGLLKPIKTEAVCLVCHGKVLAPEIAATLHRNYPNDQATGYDLGEIRGYFYAEFKK